MEQLGKKVEKSISIWLFSLSLMIFVIVILGGATRLTGSGLSMVELKVFKGVIPPLSDMEWEASFSEYKKTAEYNITYKDRGLSVEGFKDIFWLEYLHRLFARILAGVLFVVPFLYFVLRYFFIKKVLSLSIVLQLLFMFVLGAMQGLVGWIMVKSGLYEQSAYIKGSFVSVSPYRLTIHLTLALIIYAYILVMALKLSPRQGLGKEHNAGIYKLSLFITVVIGIAIISGGFVAGTKAGMVSQSFPLMLGNFNGYIIPPNLLSLSPWYINLSENMLTVQFNHRIIAYAIFGLVLYLFILLRRENLLKPSVIYSLLIMILIQLSLGVITLLSFVPQSGFTVLIGSLHQGGAFILFSISLLISYSLSKKTKAI